MNSASWAFVLIRFARVAKYASARGPGDPQGLRPTRRQIEEACELALADEREAVARDEPHGRRQDHAHLLDDWREHVGRHLGLLGGRGERDGSAVEAGKSADDRRLCVLGVERQAVLFGHDDGAQADQTDGRVAMRDVAARHGLEGAGKRTAVDARAGSDFRAERPHGEAAEAADRPEAVGLALRLGHRAAPVDVERQVGGADAELPAIDVHDERNVVQGRLTRVEAPHGGGRREAGDVDARDLHPRRQRIGRACVDERHGHEQDGEQAHARKAGAADQAPSRLPLSAHTNLR